MNTPTDYQLFDELCLIVLVDSVTTGHRYMQYCDPGDRTLFWLPQKGDREAITRAGRVFVVTDSTDVFYEVMLSRVTSEASVLTLRCAESKDELSCEIGWTLYSQEEEESGDCGPHCPFCHVDDDSDYWEDDEPSCGLAV